MPRESNNHAGVSSSYSHVPGGYETCSKDERKRTRLPADGRPVCFSGPNRCRNRTSREMRTSSPFFSTLQGRHYAERSFAFRGDSVKPARRICFHRRTTCGNPNLPFGGPNPRCERNLEALFAHRQRGIGTPPHQDRCRTFKTPETKTSRGDGDLLIVAIRREQQRQRLTMTPSGRVRSGRFHACGRNG